MRNSRCVFSTAAALHRIFIAPIELSNYHFFQHTSPSTYSRIAPSLLLPLRRRYNTTPREAPTRRLPRDDEIKSWSVVLVSEEGKLEEPRNTHDILDSIDRRTHSLIVVVAGEPGVPPICKIIDKKAMREAEKAKSKASKNPGATTKTIELNWAIDNHDLGHRMNKMKEFLGKGNKVELILAAKRKGRQATPEEAAEVIFKIREAIGAVEGAKESKAMEGKLLTPAKIFVEGKAPQY